MKLNITDLTIASKLLHEFVINYSRFIPHNQMQYIMERMLDDRYFTNPNLYPIYAHLGLLHDENNYYMQIKNLIVRKYNIGSNILEVGCGFFPTLSLMIDKEQKKVGSGSITGYDPRVISTIGFGDTKLHNKIFDSNTDISNFDLSVAVKPCEATEDFILNNNANKKPFILGFCGCVHDGRKDPLKHTDKETFAWINSTISFAERTLPNGFVIHRGIIAYDTNKVLPVIRSERIK